MGMGLRGRRGGARRRRQRRRRFGRRRRGRRGGGLGFLFLCCGAQQVDPAEQIQEEIYITQQTQNWLALTHNRPDIGNNPNNQGIPNNIDPEAMHAAFGGMGHSSVTPMGFGPPMSNAQGSAFGTPMSNAQFGAFGAQQQGTGGMEVNQASVAAALGNVPPHVKESVVKQHQERQIGIINALNQELRTETDSLKRSAMVSQYNEIVQQMKGVESMGYRYPGNGVPAPMSDMAALGPTTSAMFSIN